jgi:hypothetical protein
MPNLTFVTISNPSEAKDSTNRFLVRSRALKNHKAKKKQQRIVTQVAEAVHRSKPRNDTMQRLLYPNPKSVLSAGRVDPFSAYPRPLSSHEHWLLDYCKYCRMLFLYILTILVISEFCPKHDPLYSTEFSNALSTIWLPEAVKNRGMLDGILLVSGRDLMQVAPNKELGNLILQLRGRLIFDAKEALADKRRAIRDESIGTLIELAFDEVTTPRPNFC